jgi:HlyD family secretion protein
MSRTRPQTRLVWLVPTLVLLTWPWHSLGPYRRPASGCRGRSRRRAHSVSSKCRGRIENRGGEEGAYTLSKGGAGLYHRQPRAGGQLQTGEAGEAAAGALAQEAENGARAQQIAAAKDQWLKAKSAAQLLSEDLCAGRIFRYRDGGGFPAKRERGRRRAGWRCPS